MSWFGVFLLVLIPLYSIIGGVLFVFLRSSVIMMNGGDYIPLIFMVWVILTTLYVTFLFIWPEKK